MAVPDTKEKWTGKVNTLTIGATSEQGGTRTSTVTIGGAGCLPSLEFEGPKGNRPAIAVEIWDSDGEAMPVPVRQVYGDSLKNVADWAAKAVEFGAQMICLKLQGTHPDAGDHTAEQACDDVKAVLGAVGVPLIVWGSGVNDKDNEVLPRCCQAASGENCVFGSITEKNYRTLVAACLADKHKILAESPLDINIAKQVNILASDVGFALEDIVVFPTTASLGYGLEYVYSIMERGRLAALTGDKLLQQPVLCSIGFEAWRAKEARGSDKEVPGFGPAEKRGPLWEAATATNLFQAGADIFVMRHPEAIRMVSESLDEYYGPKGS
jgi:acetyl-CoA decarbonylase/synthase complex subunit delta